MNTVTDTLRGSAKALLAGAVAGASAGAVAAADEHVSHAEWWTIAAAVLVAVAGVWGIPNTGPKAPH